MYELLVWKRRVQPAAATPSSCLVQRVSWLPVFWMLGWWWGRPARFKFVG